MPQVELKALDVITVTAAAKQITTLSIKASMIEFHSVTGNSSVYFGNKDVATTKNIPIAAAATKAYTPSEMTHTNGGDYFDLKDFYVIGTAGDTVRIQYIQVG